MKPTLGQLIKRLPYFADVYRNLTFNQFMYLTFFLCKSFLLYPFYKLYIKNNSQISFFGETVSSKNLQKASNSIEDSLDLNMRAGDVSEPITRVMKYEASEIRLHCLRDIKFVGLDAIPFNNGQYYSPNQRRLHWKYNEWSHNMSGSPFVIGTSHFRELKRETGNFVCIRNDTNYYHYVTEELIKLYYANTLFDDFGIINNFPYLNFHRDFRELMEHPIINYRDGMKVSNLLEINRLNHSSHALKYLRDWMTEQARISDHKFNKTDYIFSVRSGSRKIQNIAEIKDVLDETGLDIRYIDFSRTSVIEDILTISECKGIIGGHGAGLTNLIWGRDLKILEIGVPRKSSCFANLSQMLGHEYRYFDTPKAGIKSNDIEVPVQDFVEFTNKYLCKTTDNNDIG